MATVYLGLGSNLGNRENNIRQALEELKKQNIIIRKCAHIIETDPVGGPPQGKFLNTAAEIETHHSPTELLVILKGIEKKLGRTKAAPNSPRRIDLDILRYDDIRLHTADLIIPHPRMLEREFVMKPLSEIAPHRREITV